MGEQSRERPKRRWSKYSQSEQGVVEIGSRWTKKLSEKEVLLDYWNSRSVEMKCYFGIALIALVMLCAAQSVPLQGKKGGVCNQDCSDDVSGPYCIEKQGKLLILQFGKCQVDSMECLRGNVRVQLERLSFIKCPKCAKRCFPSKDGSPLVCDSKGGIHDSVCMFKNAQCIDDSLQRVRCRRGKPRKPST